MSVIAIVALTIIVVYQHMRINNLVSTVGIPETNLALFSQSNSELANANTLSSRIETVEVDISSLSDEIDEQEADLQSLSRLVNSHDADLLSLSSVVNSHASDIGSLGRTGNSHASDIASLGRILNSHTSDISEIGRVVNSHASDINELSRVVNSHAADIRSLSWDLSEVARVANNANRYAHSHGYSDAALKSNIAPIVNPLERLLSVRGVSFAWNIDAHPELHLETGRDYGVLAQELVSVFPELVASDPETGFLTVDYDGLIPVLIEAIREQQSQLDALRTICAQSD